MREEGSLRLGGLAGQVAASNDHRNPSVLVAMGALLLLIVSSGTNSINRHQFTRGWWVIYHGERDVNMNLPHEFHGGVYCLEGTEGTPWVTQGAASTSLGAACDAVRDWRSCPGLRLSEFAKII